MATEWILAIAAAGTLVITILTAAVTATWIISRSGRGLTTQKQSVASETRITGQIDKATHDYGEALAALREHIRLIEKNIKDIELWNRDHLASKDDLVQVEDELKQLANLKEHVSVNKMKVDTMWDFIISHAKIEAKEKGFMINNSPLTLTPEGWRIIAPILPDVRSWCDEHPAFLNGNKDELEVELASAFSDRLVSEICEPNGIYVGACVVMLIEALRAEKVIH